MQNFTNYHTDTQAPLSPAHSQHQFPTENVFQGRPSITNVNPQGNNLLSPRSSHLLRASKKRSVFTAIQNETGENITNKLLFWGMLMVMK